MRLLRRPKFHSDSERLLYYACHSNRALQRLLAGCVSADHRRVLDTPDIFGDTALTAAACRKKALPQVATLLRAGADPNVAGWYGLTPRLNAILMGNAPAARLLAVHGGCSTPGPHNEISARGMLAHVFGLRCRSAWMGHDVELMGAPKLGVYGPIAQAFAAFCQDPHGGGDIPQPVAYGITGALERAALQPGRSVAAIAEDITANKAVILPSGWLGHATNHCFFNGYAVRVNRRLMNWHEPTWAVMRLRDARTTEGLVATLLACCHRRAALAIPQLYYQELVQGAPRWDPVRSMLTRHPCRPQSVDNCTVASAKPMIYALLVLYGIGRTAPGDPAGQAHALYKRFTTYLRFVILRDYLLRHAHRDPTAPPDTKLVDTCLATLASTGRQAQLAPLWRAQLNAARVAFIA